jgi:hypothetical protein
MPHKSITAYGAKIECFRSLLKEGRKMAHPTTDFQHERIDGIFNRGEART